MTRRMESQRGVTLVELLAARIFLTGQKQYLERLFETDRISGLVRLKGALHHALGRRIATCGAGRLALDTDSTDLDLAAWLKTRHPGADSLAFRCLELGSGLSELVDWQGRFQPQLVEYRACLTVRGRRDCLTGSVLK